MIVSEVVYEPSRRLVVRGCRECPFVREGTLTPAPFCTAALYLSGVPMPEPLVQVDSATGLYVMPEVAPSWCPLRRGGVEVVGAEAVGMAAQGTGEATEGRADG